MPPPVRVRIDLLVDENPKVGLTHCARPADSFDDMLGAVKSKALRHETVPRGYVRLQLTCVSAFISHLRFRKMSRFTRMAAMRLMQAMTARSP